MNELIKIDVRGGKQTVNARALHAWLESRQDFSHWIKGRIEQYGFSEGVDFVVDKILTQYNQVDRIDYHVTLDMAKELSMVERNEKGKEARQYFIECERKAIEAATQIAQPPQPILPSTQAKVFIKDMLEIAELFSVPLHVAQAESVKCARLTFNVDFTPLLLAAPAQSNIRAEEEMLEPTELAARLGYTSAIKMNAALADAGLQIRNGSMWEPTKAGAAISCRHQWVKGGKSGYNYKWRVSAVRDVLESNKATA